MNRAITCIFAVLIWTCTLPVAAGAFVVDWDYTLDYGFTSWTIDEGGSSALPILAEDPVTLAGDSGYRQLTWGDPVNDDARSSIWFERKVGTAQTNGPIVDVINMFHDNYPIWSTSDILTGGVVRSVLTLSPSGSTDEESFTTTFDFFFWETLNDGSYQDDIFLVASIADAEFDFLYDGIEYMVSFLPSFDLVPTENLVDNNIPWQGPAYGWTTVEEQRNEEHTKFQVTAAPVPEPSTFIVFGIGLLSLIALRRRNRS